MNKAQIKAKKRRKEERDRLPWWKKQSNTVVVNIPSLDDYFYKFRGKS